MIVAKQDGRVFHCCPSCRSVWVAGDTLRSLLRQRILERNRDNLAKLHDLQVRLDAARDLADILKDVDLSGLDGIQGLGDLVGAIADGVSGLGS